AASSSSSPPRPRPGSTASTPCSERSPPGWRRSHPSSASRPAPATGRSRTRRSSGWRSMTVELLWWDGCPSYPEALAELRRILREEGLEAEVSSVQIEDDEQARRERFPGSPTIRIDGEDIAPPD